MLDRMQCKDKLQELYPNLWKGIKLDWWHRNHSNQLSGSAIQYWLTEDGYAPHLAGLDNLVGHAFAMHTALMLADSEGRIDVSIWSWMGPWA
jgi:hypothetical protein